MLVRTRPYRPSVAFRTTDRSFDRTFEQLTNSLFTSTRRTPVVDASWLDGDLEITVDLPGVAAEHVGVAVSGRTLTLSAQTVETSWERSITIGAALDPESVTARHVDGRLTVKVAAAAKPEARTIEIATTVPVAIDAGEPAPEPGEGQAENGTNDNA